MNSPTRTVSIDMGGAAPLNIRDIIVKPSNNEESFKKATGSAILMSPNHSEDHRPNDSYMVHDFVRKRTPSPVRRSPTPRRSVESPSRVDRSSPPKDAGDPGDDIMGLEMLANPRKKKIEKPPNEDSSENDAKSEHNSHEALFDREDENIYKSPVGNSPTRRSSPRRSSRRRSSRRPSSRRKTPIQSPYDYKPRSASPKKRLTYEEQQQRKIEILDGFDKLRRRGVNVRRDFNMNDELDDMEFEYNRLKKQMEVEASIKFQRKMLMAFVTGVEYLNNRYDPFDLTLDGWSESVMEDVHNYDTIFEELHDKYKTKVQMAPELKLLFAVGGSAFMFHLTNSLFKNALPGIGGNPQMLRGMRKMASGAVSGMMNGGLGGGLGAMFGGGGMGGGGMPSRSAPQAANMRPSHSNSRPAGFSAGSQSPKMRGPSGNMDDLLSDLISKDPAEIDHSVAQDIDAILNNDRFSEASEDDVRDVNVRS